MRFTFLAFALALLTLPATAQDRKDADPQSSTSILINGQPIKGKVLEIDGKHYVAVEDVAQSLRGTISYGDGQIALTLSQHSSMTVEPPQSQPASAAAQPPSVQSPSTTAQPPQSHPPTITAQQPSPQHPAMAVEAPETGSIKGTLTYFYSVQTGSKPDTGSKVWVVQGHVEIPADQKFVGSSTAIGTTGNPEQYKAVVYSVADKNGNFEFLDIPPGQYTVIMQSAHTKGALKAKNNLFGRGNGRTVRDSSGRIESLDLQIKAGEMADGSKDFGPDIGS